MKTPSWIRIFSARRRAIKKADAARDTQRADAAASLYRAVLTRWGADFGVLIQYGNALKDSGAYDEADSAYLEALSIRPDNADAFLQRGHLQKLVGNLNEAEDLYRAAHELDPSLRDPVVELEALTGRGMQISKDTARRIGDESRSHISGQGLSIPAAVLYRRIINQHRWRRG